VVQSLSSKSRALTLGLHRWQAHGLALLLGCLQLVGVRGRGVLVWPQGLVHMVGAQHHLHGTDFPLLHTSCTSDSM